MPSPAQLIARLAPNSMWRRRIWAIGAVLFGFCGSWVSSCQLAGVGSHASIKPAVFIIPKPPPPTIMNSNFQNTTPLAARPEDPEKALLSPPGPPSYYTVHQTVGAEEVLPQDRRRIVRRRRLCHFAACTLLLFLFWSPLVDSVASVFYKVSVLIKLHFRPNSIAHPCPAPPIAFPQIAVCQPPLGARDHGQPF